VSLGNVPLDTLQVISSTVLQAITCIGTANTKINSEINQTRAKNTIITRHSCTGRYCCGAY